MTRHTSPNNRKIVPVLNQDGTPLTPTRPSRARRWLESGKATKTWLHGHFAVKLTEKQEHPQTPEISLNVNPGAKTTGIAVAIQHPTGETTNIAAFELHHRGHRISQSMTARQKHRRNRRGRIRRRPARFNNRTRNDDWLPPSMRSRLSNVTTTIRHLRELFPVKAFIIETYRFDPRLLRDPGVRGKGYQHSERGKMQVREYVLQRDNRTCQYQQACKGGKHQRLETDHIVPRSQGGTDRIDNLITSCRKCNQAKADQSIEQFLAHNKARLLRIQTQLKKPMASATHLNQLIPLLRTTLTETGLPVAETDAITTAYTRMVLGIPKTHVNDALSLGEPLGVNNLPERITLIKAIGHGSRQMLTPPSKHGTPRYQQGPKGKHEGYRAYCGIPRAIQGFTTTPGHKLQQRRSQGITSGDLNQSQGENAQKHGVN